jgi:hypothetical protein
MTYHEILADYNHHAKQIDDDEIEFFSKHQRANFEEVLLLAGLAINAEGNRLAHMNRLRYASLSRGLTAIIVHKEALRNQSDFNALLNMIYMTLNGVDHLNEMYWYDTALRIGAYLEKLPDHIYLHCGTRDGAIALEINTRKENGNYRVFIDIEDLPPELRDDSLKPLHYESLLCIYKDDFPPQH